MVNDREAGMGQVKVQHSVDCRTDARTNRHKLNVWAENRQALMGNTGYSNTTVRQCM